MYEGRYEAFEEIPDQTELLEVTKRLEAGFSRVESIVTNRTPKGTEVQTFSLGGQVEEGERLSLIAASTQAAVRQMKRDFDDWLQLKTDGQRSGFVLFWREKPNIVSHSYRLYPDDERLPFTITRYALWWRCAVEKAGDK